VISAPCLDALRAAATLAHALPLRVQLRHDGRTIVTVSRPPFDSSSGSHLITPCGFRSAVGEAWRLQEDGHPVGFCGLPVGEEPAVAVGVPPGGETRPGGIYQLPWPGGLLTALATTAPPAIVEAAASRHAMTPHLDRVTGASLISVESDPEEAGAAAELLEAVLVAVATEELFASVTG
jgi:hypothetical protein